MLLFGFVFLFFFFFNDPSTTEIYTLSLHDALPILFHRRVDAVEKALHQPREEADEGDRKSTRLNSSHLGISYAVFCLKKKKKTKNKNNNILQKAKRSMNNR